MSRTMKYTEELYVEHCCACGTVFAMSNDLNDRLRKSHKTFYCPSGHGQSYKAKSKADKLSDELALARRAIKKAKADAEWQAARKREAQEGARIAEYRRRAAKGQLTRARNRIAKGVCPCCNRTFENLARHMASKHPDYAEPTP